MKIHSLIGPASPWRFFTLALGLSWLFWMPVVLSGRNVMVFPFALLGLSGLLGPALAEIILIFRTGSKEEQHDYWQRVFDFRRIRGGWWAAILLTFPVINTLAMLLNVWTGGAWPEFDQARRIFSQPWTILPYALFILFFGPVPEELGWRGYALDSLPASPLAGPGLQSDPGDGVVALASAPVLHGRDRATRSDRLWHAWFLVVYGRSRGDFHPVHLDLQPHAAQHTFGHPVPLHDQLQRGTLLLTGASPSDEPSADHHPGAVGDLDLGSRDAGATAWTQIMGAKRNGSKKAWKKAGSILKRFFDRGICPYQLASVLSFPLRRFIFSPERLVERLALNETYRVLELGPGPGFFSASVARCIPRGYLLLLDIQREMLEMANNRLERAEIRNAGGVQADGSRLPLRCGHFDVVFLVAVLGEVYEPSDCLKEIYRVLRPDGLLSITEQPGDPDFLPLAEVQSLAKGAGFYLERVCGRGKNFTINFRKYVSSPSTTK